MINETAGKALKVAAGSLEAGLKDGTAVKIGADGFGGVFWKEEALPIIVCLRCGAGCFLYLLSHHILSISSAVVQSF